MNAEADATPGTDTDWQGQQLRFLNAFEPISPAGATISMQG